MTGGRRGRGGRGRREGRGERRGEFAVPGYGPAIFRERVEAAVEGLIVGVGASGASFVMRWGHAAFRLGEQLWDVGF